MRDWWARFVAWANEGVYELRDCADCQHTLLYPVSRRDAAAGYEYACEDCGAFFLLPGEHGLLTSS